MSFGLCSWFTWVGKSRCTCWRCHSCLIPLPCLKASVCILSVFTQQLIVCYIDLIVPRVFCQVKAQSWVANWVKWFVYFMDLNVCLSPMFPLPLSVNEHLQTRDSVRFNFSGNNHVSFHLLLLHYYLGHFLLFLQQNQIALDHHGFWELYSQFIPKQAFAQAEQKAKILRSYGWRDKLGVETKCLLVKLD